MNISRELEPEHTLGGKHNFTRTERYGFDTTSHSHPVTWIFICCVGTLVSSSLRASLQVEVHMFRLSPALLAFNL